MDNEHTVVPSRQVHADDMLVEAWLHGRSPHTQRAYAADVRRFREVEPKQLAAVTVADLQSFADGLTHLAPTSRYRILSTIKSLLAFGHRVGFLQFDVGRVLQLPTTRNRLAERILSESDVHRMLNLETNDRNRTILTLLYASGIRVAELCGLRWRDLQSNGATGQISVFGKGGTTRSIWLPSSVWNQVSALRGRSDPDEPVFRSRKKRGALTPLAVLRIVRAAAQRAGIVGNVSPHWLRHAHASHALDRGAPIHLVQATLGHASITTTGRYLHARPNESSSRFLGL